MHALVDADILVYRIAFTTEEENFGIAAWRMSNLIEQILDSVKATSFQLYLTASKDDTAFRRKIYPEYKGNRKAPRPIHYDDLRDFLVREWEAKMVSCIEADDAIGIDSNRSDCVIVSIDKDLLQLPGLHYNFVKEEFKTVTKEEGIRFFYQQCLTGDKADNVKGIDGIGPVKANKILDKATELYEDLDCGDLELNWFNAVRKEYDNDYEFYVNGACLWILRSPYPQGSFKYHPLGSQLVHEMDNEPMSSQSVTSDTMEQPISQTSLDGQVSNGKSLTETTSPMEQMD